MENGKNDALTDYSLRYKVLVQGVGSAALGAEHAVQINPPVFQRSVRDSIPKFLKLLGNIRVVTNTKKLAHDQNELIIID